MLLPLNLRRSIEQLIRNTFKPYQDEILVNADCEDGLPILNTAGVQNNCLAVLTTDRAFSGSKSVKLSAEPSSGTTDRFLGLGLGGVLNGLKLGETYELTCWVYVPGGQSITLTNVYLRLYDYQGSFATYDSNTPTANDRWEKLSVRFTTRAAATQLFARCYLAEGSNDGRYILLDHFRLKIGPRVSTATPQSLSFGNTASAGSSPQPSANDHIHPLTGTVRIGDLDPFPGCSVYNSAAISIPTSTWTTLTFDSEHHDYVVSMHSPITNPSRITIPSNCAGLYLIRARTEWANGTNGARGINILLNGTTVIDVDVRNQTGTAAPSITNPTNVVSRIYKLAVGDYVEVQAYQATDAGGLNINRTSDYTPIFQLQYLGPASP